VRVLKNLDHGYLSKTLIIKTNNKMKKSFLKGFWSPSQVSTLIVLIEKIISLVGKIYKLIDLFSGKGGLSFPF
jgi:hypothetical protein